MPFGWVGFDAAGIRLHGAPNRLRRLQCLSAGWALMPQALEFRSKCGAGWSPMPFGWVGFDALKAPLELRPMSQCLQCLSAGWALMPCRDYEEFMELQESLQCLSAGWALMPYYASRAAVQDVFGLQCLSAGWALMPGYGGSASEVAGLVSNAFRLGGL